MLPTEIDSAAGGRDGECSKDSKTNSWDASKPIIFATSCKLDQTWNPSSPLLFAERSRYSTHTGARSISTGTSRSQIPSPDPSAASTSTNAAAFKPAAISKPAYKTRPLRSGTLQRRKSLDTGDQLNMIMQVLDAKRQQRPERPVALATKAAPARKAKSAPAPLVGPAAAKRPKPPGRATKRAASNRWTESARAKIKASSQGSDLVIMLRTPSAPPGKASKPSRPVEATYRSPQENVEEHRDNAKEDQQNLQTEAKKTRIDVAKSTRILALQSQVGQVDETYDEAESEVFEEFIGAQERAELRGSYTKWSRLFRKRRERAYDLRKYIQDFAAGFSMTRQRHTLQPMGPSSDLDNTSPEPPMTRSQIVVQLYADPSMGSRKQQYLIRLATAFKYRFAEAENLLHHIRAQQRMQLEDDESDSFSLCLHLTFPGSRAFRWHIWAFTLLQDAVRQFTQRVEGSSMQFRSCETDQLVTTPWCTTEPAWVADVPGLADEHELSGPPIARNAGAQQLLSAMALAFDDAMRLDINFFGFFGLGHRLAISRLASEDPLRQAKFVAYYPFARYRSQAREFWRSNDPYTSRFFKAHPIFLHLWEIIEVINDLIATICKRLDEDYKRGVPYPSNKQLEDAISMILQDVRGKGNLHPRLICKDLDIGRHRSSISAPENTERSQQRGMTRLREVDSAQHPPVGDKSTEGEAYYPLSYQIPQDALRRAMLTSGTSADHYWSHDLYRGPQNERVNVHYCRSKDAAERVARDFLGKPVVGFDIEWKPQATSTSAEGFKEHVSLIQLAAEDRIALFHIALFKETTIDTILPPTLRKILESVETIKCGVSIRSDATRIKTHLGVDVKALFELSHLHNLVMFSEKQPAKVNKRLVSLQRQVEQHLQLTLLKGEVRTSDWSKVLDFQQCTYAAADAYAGLRVFDALEAKRYALNPRPPRPAFAELELPIQLAQSVQLSDQEPSNELSSASASGSWESSECDESDESDESTEESDEEVGLLEDGLQQLELGSAAGIGEQLDAETFSDSDKSSDYESAQEDKEHPTPPAQQRPSTKGKHDFVDHVHTCEPAAAGTCNEEHRTEAASHVAKAQAENWVEVWKSDRRATGRANKVPAAALRAYSLWHHQRLEPLEVAQMLRDPPLKPTTVSMYVLDCILLEKLDYDKRRAEQVLRAVPWAMRRRYESIARKL